MESFETVKKVSLVFIHITNSTICDLHILQYRDPQMVMCVTNASQLWRRTGANTANSVQHLEILLAQKDFDILPHQALQNRKE